MKLTIVPDLFPCESISSLRCEPLAYRVTRAPKGRQIFILLDDQEWKVNDTRRAVSEWKHRRFQSAGDALLALDTEL